MPKVDAKEQEEVLDIENCIFLNIDFLSNLYPDDIANLRNHVEFENLQTAIEQGSKYDFIKALKFYFDVLSAESPRYYEELRKKIKNWKSISTCTKYTGGACLLVAPGHLITRFIKPGVSAVAGFAGAMLLLAFNLANTYKEKIEKKAESKLRSSHELSNCIHDTENSETESK